MCAVAKSAVCAISKNNQYTLHLTLRLACTDSHLHCTTSLRLDNHICSFDEFPEAQTRISQPLHSDVLTERTLKCAK